MATRSAEFVVYSSPTNIKELGYTECVKAVCILNDQFEAFTVYETGFWKKKFGLSVKLHWFKTGRPCGNKEFDTFEEAVEFGRQFIRDRFPEVEQPKPAKAEVEASWATNPDRSGGQFTADEIANSTAWR